MTNTRKRSWKKNAPGTHARTVMLKKCGKKCFLGPKKSFPICTKGTCRVNPRGVRAALARASEWKYATIANKARRMFRRLTLKK